jgi:uncharacterized protein YndB with AHSA1/START domain
VTHPVVRSIRVSCGLYDAFTTFTACIDLWWPVAHRRFPDSIVVMEPWVGGGFFEKNPDGKAVRLGEVVRFDPPRALSYTWYPGAIEKPTLVHVSFVEDGDAVLVTVTHAEGESALGMEWEKRSVRFAKSWEEVLPAFASYLASEESDRQEGE